VRGPGAAGHGWRLILDTSTRRSVVAIGRGAAVAAASERDLPGRQGASILAQLDEVLAAVRARPGALEAIGVGVGPGSFTGLRVGLAVAKTMAWDLTLPLVGLPTPEVLVRALDPAGSLGRVAVVLPAGARDHYLAVPPEPALLVPARRALAEALGGLPALALDVEPSRLGDVAGPAGSSPLEAGARALAGIAAAAMAILDERLVAGARDDPSTLVPRYVAAPRGAPRDQEAEAWSPVLR
jgi:tRNA threonylcarbamoyladenosine biosynthesis protein TsaB